MHFKKFRKIISPKFGEGICGDPTILRPEDSPDGLWHIFYWCFYGLSARITHLKSSDTISWQRVRSIGSKNPVSLIGIVRPFIVKDNGNFYLFVQKLGAVKAESEIGVYISNDLVNWSKYRTVYKNNDVEVVSCPSVSKEGDKWKLYFSAGVIFTNDFAYTEPKRLYSVTSDSIDGMYGGLEEEYGFSHSTEYIARPTLRIRESKFGGQIAISNNMIRLSSDNSLISILCIDKYDRVGDSQEIVRIVPTDINSRVSHVYVGDGDLDRVFFDAREDPKGLMKRKLSRMFPDFSYGSLKYRLVVLFVVLLFTREHIYMAEI